MNVAQYTELETLLLDRLADGQWHPSTKIWNRFSDMMDLLDGFVERETLLAGANQSYRFIAGPLRMWRLLSPTLDRTSQQLTPRYFGGILEDDGWYKAPLRECHLIHFKASEKLSKKVLSELVDEPENMINLNEDGLYKIFSYEKTKTYDRVKQIKELFPEYQISGIRLESNLRRRNLEELPSRYLSDMCKHYGQFAKVLLRGQMSSIKKHLPDEDDAQQQIYLWVIEAIKRYDDSTSIPFAAYLGTNIRKWVYDLNRKAYGRSIADKELNHARATNEFRANEERNPTAEELAELLNLSVTEVNKEREDINTVVNLRNQKAIEYDDFELPLPAEEQTDANLDTLIESTILSASITTAARQQNGKRNITGLVALYYKTWGVDVENKRIKSWLRSKSTVQALEEITTQAEKIIVDTRRNDSKI
jgi:DNA-directed RNA polymerase specialized sigma subunit